MAPESQNEVRDSEPANPNAINQGSSEGQSREEQMEERRKIRRLQLMMDMVMSVIGQDPNLTVDEAAEMVADTAAPPWPCSRTRNSLTTSSISPGSSA